MYDIFLCMVSYIHGNVPGIIFGSITFHGTIMFMPKKCLGYNILLDDLLSIAI